MMLGLETEPGAPVIHRAGLAGNAVEIIAGVQLDRRFRGEYFEHPAAGRLGHPRRAPEPTVRAVDREAVIVAAADAELLVVVVDSRADRGTMPEIERRAVHQAQLAGRNLAEADRGDARCIEHQPMAED